MHCYHSVLLCIMHDWATCRNTQTFCHAKVTYSRYRKQLIGVVEKFYHFRSNYGLLQGTALSQLGISELAQHLRAPPRQPSLKNQQNKSPMQLFFLKLERLELHISTQMHSTPAGSHIPGRQGRVRLPTRIRAYDAEQHMLWAVRPGAACLTVAVGTRLAFPNSYSSQL